MSGTATISDLTCERVTSAEVLRRQVRHASVHWYLPEMKTAFAGTTTATRDLIVDMAERFPGDRVTTILHAINYDPDARGVLQVYIDAGYGDETIGDLLNNRIPRKKPTKREAAR